jgi:hypothetical protein
MERPDLDRRRPLVAISHVFGNERGARYRPKPNASVVVIIGLLLGRRPVIFPAKHRLRGPEHHVDIRYGIEMTFQFAEGFFCLDNPPQKLRVYDLRSSPIFCRMNSEEPETFPP